MPGIAVYTYDFAIGAGNDWPEVDFTPLPDRRYWANGALRLVDRYGIDIQKGGVTFESWGVPPGAIPTHCQAQATFRRNYGACYRVSIGFIAYSLSEGAPFTFGAGRDNPGFDLLADTPFTERGRRVAVFPWAKRSDQSLIGSFSGAGKYLNGPPLWEMECSSLTITVDYEDGEPTTGPWDVEAADTFRGVTAAAGFSRAQTATTKAIVIGINRGIPGRIGSGQGSRDGWEEYVWGDVDKRSRIGLAFGLDGALYLLFEDYSSGSAVAMLSVNRAFGIGPREAWSVPAAVTPNVAAITAVGRAQRQIWGMRVA